MDQTSNSEKIYQREKFNNIIEALLSSGYFRVRIANLSEFDKVVGGLCWCITSSGVSDYITMCLDILIYNSYSTI